MTSKKFVFWKDGKQYEYGVRHRGSFYPLENLVKHFDAFKSLQNSNNIELELKTIASNFSYMKYEDSELEIEMDKIIHTGIPCCHNASTMAMGMETLLSWVTLDDTYYGYDNIYYQGVDIMQSIIQILDEWGASTILRKSYQNIFPYFDKGHFSFIENPALQCFCVNKKWLCHWEMLKNARLKEGQQCKKNVL